MPRRSLILVLTLAALSATGAVLQPPSAADRPAAAGPTPQHPGPGFASTHAADPVEDAARALAEGRPWHAARLLRNAPIDPTTVLLAARADAGRLAWREVIRRLGSAAWIDSVAGGEGRALLARARLETRDYEGAALDFRRYLQYAVDRRPRGLAEVGFARALTALDRPSAAAAAYGRAAELLQEIEPWLAFRAAEATAALGDTAALAAWLERASEVPDARRARVRADALHAAGDTAAAIDLLLAAAAQGVSGSPRAELRTRAARWQLARADTAAARATLRATVRDDPGSALEGAGLLAHLPDLHGQDRRALARVYESSGYRARAVPELRAYLAAEELSAGERLELELRIGELLFDSGSYIAAVGALERVLAGEPPRSIAARAEFVAARARYRAGHRADGRAALRRVADRYRGSGVALRALSLLGALYDSGEGGERAEALYLEMARDYPGTRLGGEARFRLGILAMAQGELARAREHFDILRRQNRRTELGVQSAYWAARARLAEGGDSLRAEAADLLEEVRASDPFGYYGLLAAERLDADPWTRLPPGPAPGELDPEIAAAFERIEILRHAGFHEDALIVLERALQAEPDDPERLLALSATLVRHGYGARAVRLGWLVHARLRGRWSRTVLSAIYPLAYPDILMAEARERGLDPALLAAVARQESHFAPDAVSRAGARGLLQLMPATAREWARRSGVADYREELLFHPEINMHLGAAYLDHLVGRYPELHLALVAYNAGPTRARQWDRRHGHPADPELFTERIPFRETRTYVKAIERHVRIYRALYRELLHRDERLPTAVEAPNTR